MGYIKYLMDEDKIHRTSEGKCPNCGKELFKERSELVEKERSLCPECHSGCFESENDDTPGFRDSWATKCCKCGYLVPWG
jgi:hypothetical protein